MASTISTAAASRVNRRFLLLAFILGLLAAVLIYAWMSRSSSTTTGGSGDVPVVVAKAAIPPGTRISADMIGLRQVQQSAAGSDALSSTQLAIGQVTRYPISAGEQIFASKLVATTVPFNTALSYVIQPGMRAMSITVKEVTDAGGLILPGDHVDVIWVPLKGAPAFVLLSDIEVTAVSQSIVDVVPSAPGLTSGTSAQPTATGQRARNSDAKVNANAITATLMLAPPQTVALLCSESYADANSGELRLALRAFGDTSPVAPNAPECPPIALAAQINPKQ